MQPKNITITKGTISMQLVGCVFYGDPFHSVGGWDTANEIGLTWKRFMSLYDKHKAYLSKHRINRNISYEVHIEPDEYKEDKKFYVFVGVEVTGLGEIPLEMFGLVLPRTKYAVITFKGKDMFNGGDFIWGQWLPSSAYQESHPFLIQAYDETRFHGLHDEASELDWMVPIRKRV